MENKTFGEKEKPLFSEKTNLQKGNALNDPEIYPKVEKVISND